MSPTQEALYTLEVFEPGAAKTVLFTLESSQPFLPICAGDLINPRAWEGVYEGKILRVVTVEHLIWRFGKVLKHKILVLPEWVEDTASVRWSPGRPPG